MKKENNMIVYAYGAWRKATNKRVNPILKKGLFVVTVKLGRRQKETDVIVHEGEIQED